VTSDILADWRLNQMYEVDERDRVVPLERVPQSSAGAAPLCSTFITPLQHGLRFYRVGKSLEEGDLHELVKPLIGIQRVEVPGAADKAASLGGENPSAVNCLIQTASIPDARNGNDA
jgi:hypothetical protein